MIRMEKEKIRKLKDLLAELLVPRQMSLTERQELAFKMLALIIQIETVVQDPKIEDLGGSSEKYIR